MARGESGIAKQPQIWVDPAKAREHRARKAHRLNVIQFPVLRLIGFVLLLAAVFLHGRYISGDFEASLWWTAALLFLAYCFISWIALALAYERLRPFDLGLLFLALDLPLWTVAIYISGGEKSWLFFVLALRVADQTHTSMRRALVFGHIGTLCYLGMLFYLAAIDGRPLDWSEGLTKAFLIYFANLYISLAAHTAEGLRHRMVAAIRVARDSISRLREQSVQLEKARVDAEQASQAKSDFLAMISHELRTPMAGVIGTTDLLLRDCPGGEPHRYLETIRSSSEALLSIIDEILDFTRLESTEIGRREEELRPRSLLRGVIELLTPAATAKGLRLEMELDDAVPQVLVGDAGHLRQILINLANNAIKYSNEGTIRIRLRTAAEVPAPASGAALYCFEVEDQGIGIPPEVGKEIFEPFYQVDRSMARQHGGTGLGLAITRRLAAILGGELSYRSALGVGTTFCLTLPLAGVANGKARHDSIDLKRLSRLLGDAGSDPELLRKWRGLFLRDSLRHLADLRRDRDRGDLGGLIRKAERFATEARGLGAETLAAAYRSLALAAEEDSKEDMDSALADIDRWLRQVEVAPEEALQLS